MSIICFLTLKFAVILKMSPFRWPKVEHDIALCKEVIASRPKKAEEWETIATVLSDIFSTDEVPVVLKARACREHLDLLLKKFRANEKVALKRYLNLILFYSFFIFMSFKT